jgi:phosphoribosylanthranilate isomerase
MCKIKICGLSREADIEAVNEGKPDYIGFVFAKSRRQVTAASAAALRARLRDGIVPVGVFVNANMADIISLFQNGVIAMAQLHGTESDAYMTALKDRCPNISLNKAVRSDTEFGVLRRDTPADYFLLDHGAGGTGQSFDWKILEDKDVRQNIKRPFFLAGGVNPSNIERAVGLHPYAIDVSSGVETEGVKDRDKILYIINKVRIG